MAGRRNARAGLCLILLLCGSPRLISLQVQKDCSVDYGWRVSCLTVDLVISILSRNCINSLVEFWSGCCHNCYRKQHGGHCGDHGFGIVVGIRQIASCCKPSQGSNRVVVGVKTYSLITESSDKQYWWMNVVGDSIFIIFKFSFVCL